MTKTLSRPCGCVFFRVAPFFRVARGLFTPPTSSSRRPTTDGPTIGKLVPCPARFVSSRMCTGERLSHWLAPVPGFFQISSSPRQFPCGRSARLAGCFCSYVTGLDPARPDGMGRDRTRLDFGGDEIPRRDLTRPGSTGLDRTGLVATRHD